MLAFTKHHDLPEFDDRLRDASEVTAELMSAILAETWQRFPPLRRAAEAARIERLIRSEAWTDAALALIDLEQPRWQLRRLAYDGGEWHCSLSRQRDLPEWLDQSIETHHTDLSLAILSAFLDAQRIPAPSNRASVPMMPRETNPLYEPVVTDNFA
jgi:hypothetical protein